MFCGVCSNRAKSSTAEEDLDPLHPKENPILQVGSLHILQSAIRDSAILHTGSDRYFHIGKLAEVEQKHILRWHFLQQICLQFVCLMIMLPCHSQLALRCMPLQGYLLPNVHGTFRRYLLELLVVAGLLLPWIGPAFGLAVMTPIVLLTVQNGKVVTPESDCFSGGTGPATCPATSYFDYYFWNISNPAEVAKQSWPHS